MTPEEFKQKYPGVLSDLLQTFDRLAKFEGTFDVSPPETQLILGAEIGEPRGAKTYTKADNNVGGAGSLIVLRFVPNDQ